MSNVSIGHPLDVLRSVLREARCAWWVFVALGLLFHGVLAALLTPAAAGLLRCLLTRQEGGAISNTDIAAFALTPLGAVTLAALAVVYTMVHLWETAVLLRAADAARSSTHVRIGPTLLRVFADAPRVARLAGMMSLLVTLLLAPIVLALGAAYLLLLSGADINYFLSQRPPAFRIALGIGAVGALAAAALGAWCYLRWLLALPILLFEGGAARAALRESRRRICGHRLRAGAYLLTQYVGCSLLGFGLTALFLLAADRLLDRYATPLSTLVPLVGVVLIAHAILSAAVTFATLLLHALLILTVYRALSPAAPAAPRTPPAAWGTTRIAVWSGVGVAAAVVLGVGIGATVLEQAETEHPVAITAHRGASRVAPENTLAAVRLAHELGADLAEIDVQSTADGAVVVIHDRDLMRMAGLPGRIAEMPLADVQAADVGSRFAAEFAGERVPTLEEVIAYARGRIDLNIELKIYGDDRRVAEQTADLIARMNFESHCIVMSLDHESIRRARARNAGLRIGLIVSAALGDIGRLDVDALSVRAALATDALVTEAHAAGRQVHVWTLDDAAAALPLLARGVDNIITNDPPLMVDVRRTWREQGATGRALLSVRELLR